ncbi:MAG TPA: nucleoside-diphosphate kinase [Patescibacteria group bacterium]|nr:nucleoside-diphosphate kinase [Patescibacteria group bacterium]
MKNPLIEQTIVLVKPDGVKRALVGEVISRFEKIGLKIIGMKMVWIDEEMVRKHYPTTRKEWVTKIGEKTLEAYKTYGTDPNEHLGTMKPYEIGLLICKWLVDYLTSGPVVAMVLEGPHAIPAVRKIAGYTYPDAAIPGTIRGDFSIDSPDLANMGKRSGMNIVHASGNAEEAKFEIELWFRKEELYDYKRSDEEIMFGL